jgi:hypothetical protein
MTTITALPTPPARSDPANFRARADGFLGALPAFVTEANTVAGEINAAAAAAAASETNAAAAAAAAAASETAAANSAASAASAASAPMWVSGASYTAGQCVWSPLDFQTYRARVNTSGTTDPAAAPAAWERLGGRIPDFFLIQEGVI